MINKVIDIVNKYDMLQNGDNVLVAVSGGADSMCLLSLLIKLKAHYNLNIEVAHVNHCIRGEESDSDEKFVRLFCESKNIICHVARINIPEICTNTNESTELVARKKRYEYFNSLSFDKIATAHTGSDRIETMLMNLSRGASLNGLCSIPEKRGNIIRPLLCFTRDEIENYCEQNNIPYVVDSSNLTDEYTRNKFRHNVIPALMSINPTFEKNALKCLELINDDNLYLEAQANNLLNNQLNEDLSLSVDNLTLDKNILSRLIVLFLDKNDCIDYDKRHIDYIVNNIGNTFSIVLPGNKILKCKNDKLFFKNPKDEQIQFDPIFVKKGCDCSVPFLNKAIHLYWTDKLPNECGDIYIADADLLCDEICIRTRQQGDMFSLGVGRPTKTLKKLFIEEKIPVEVRDLLFVLSNAEKVLYVECFGINPKVRVTNKTVRYLIIKTECENNDQ